MNEDVRVGGRRRLNASDWLTDRLAGCRLVTLVKNMIEMQYSPYSYNIKFLTGSP